MRELRSSREVLDGEEALARGALDSGVRLVASYPGSPSSKAVMSLLERAERSRVYVEWSSNEKVALEMGIGASIAGRRALVAVKSVGINVAVDPLMTLNLTGVNGGLVILLGDDPGGYGSQNDQDTRPLFPFLELPLLEPASPSEAYEMIAAAFEASEHFLTAVVLRITRAFSREREEVRIKDRGDEVRQSRGLARDTWRFVPVPRNAVKKHRELHDKLERLRGWGDEVAWNHVIKNATRSDESRGIVAGGFVYRKLLDVIGELPPCRILKLGSLFPLPRNLPGRFFRGLREVLVLEEIEPFLEDRLAALGHGLGLGVRIRGKRTGDVEGRQGELFRWQIQEALTGFLTDFVPSRSYLKDAEDEERPKLKNHCAGCDYGAVFDALDQAARELGQRPILVGDPGCLVTVAERLDAKFAMGSAVAVADGLAKSGAGERAVAIFGDSSFFHMTLPAIVNAVHNRSDVLMIVLDNGAAVTTGSQPHPGVGQDAFGEAAPAVDMLRVARACGVEQVSYIDLPKGGLADACQLLRELFRRALERRVLTLLCVRLSCAEVKS